MSTHSIHNAFNEYYFVTFTCYQWLPLFETSDIYDYLPSWAEEINKRGVLICGYVVMPNHIHLLVYLKSRSKGLNHVIGEAKRFLAYEIISRLRKKNENQLLDLLTKGVQETERMKSKRHQVFRLSFDAKLINDAEGMHRTLDYIHHNPVSGKWNLVDDFVDFEYSSAEFYENGKQKFIKVCHFLDASDSSEFPGDNSEG